MNETLQLIDVNATNSVLVHKETRVYSVLRGAEELILKYSRKTAPPEANLPIRNDLIPLSATEEFEMANDLFSNETQTYYDIQSTWEHPIQVLRDNQGYEGVLFEKIDGFQEGDTKKVVQAIYEGLQTVPERYQEEYSELSKLLSGNEASELSFEDFLKLRAAWMYKTAWYLHERSKLSYSNQDNNADSVMYRVTPQAEIVFTLVGYDVEYFEKNSSINPSRKKLIDQEFRTLSDGMYRYWFSEPLKASQRSLYDSYVSILKDE